MKKLSAIISLAVLFTTISCVPHLARQSDYVTLQKKEWSNSNPTSYAFDATINDVQVAIKKASNQWREKTTKKYQARVWKGNGDVETQRLFTLALQSSGLMHLGWKDEGILVSQRLPAMPENKNDAYLHGGDSPIGESQIYFKDGQKLIYFANFHIHLTAVAPQKTRVEIFTYGSQVIAGLDKSWSPHGSSFIFVDVEPTTIEQYQILVGIGEQLGTKDMPQLITPRPDSPAIELKLPRER
jgi:hypothetical protein